MSRHVRSCHAMSVCQSVSLSVRPSVSLSVFKDRMSYMYDVCLDCLYVCRLVNLHVYIFNVLYISMLVSLTAYVSISLSVFMPLLT